jgi:sortase (surface protein transpeptidase)
MAGDLTPPSGRHISPLRAVRRPAAIALIAGILVAGIGVTGLALASQTGHAAVPVGRPKLVPVPLGRQAAAPQPTMHQVPAPTRLIIPSIGVRTQLVRLGLTTSGALQVPASAAVAGWYTGSSRPGAIGAAVIVGHIDSETAPGVFLRLRLLRPGRLVYVRRADGSLAVFRVTAVHSYQKAGFPTLAVYGPTPNAQLRLITCGGAFDFETGHYLSNVIVYAALAPSVGHAKRARRGTCPARSAASHGRRCGRWPGPRATRRAAART